MKRYLNRDEMIDRLSDYAGENYYNRNRFAVEVDEFDSFFKNLEKVEAQEVQESERFDTK